MLTGTKLGLGTMLKGVTNILWLNNYLSVLPVCTPVGAFTTCGGRKHESKKWIPDIRRSANSGMTLLSIYDL